MFFRDSFGKKKKKKDVMCFFDDIFDKIKKECSSTIYICFEINIIGLDNRSQLIRFITSDLKKMQMLWQHCSMCSYGLELFWHPTSLKCILPCAAASSCFIFLPCHLTMLTNPGILFWTYTLDFMEVCTICLLCEELEHILKRLRTLDQWNSNSRFSSLVPR